MRFRRRVFLESVGSGAIGLTGALLAPRPALGQGSPLFHLPYVQQLQAERGTILWSTRERGVGAVQFSTDRSFSLSVTSSIREFSSNDTGSLPFYLNEVGLTG